MRRKVQFLVALALTCALALPSALLAQDSTRAPRIDRAQHHEFVIDGFRTEGGAVLPHARIVYGTYGHLDATHSNAVLLPSHYMADHHGYEWLIGPGKALDTSRVFLVATELFGNGHSSSPSNTPEPFHGPRFPLVTIRDNVAAVKRLLADDLGITHLRAVIGFSMGAQQAFQWAVSEPAFADRIVATSGTAKTYGHGIVRLESEIAAITADATFAGGDYSAQPTKGIEAFALVWTAWLYSQEWWRRELWRVGAPAGTTLDKVIGNYRTNFIPNADANDLILQMRTWEHHDVGTTPGFDGDVERALRSIRAPVLYMPSATDLYFPVGDARYEARFIPHVMLKPIPSLWGHPAGAAPNAADAKFLNDAIRKFLGEAHVGTRRIARPGQGTFTSRQERLPAVKIVYQRSSRINANRKRRTDANTTAGLRAELIQEYRLAFISVAVVHDDSRLLQFSRRFAPTAGKRS